MVYKDRDLDTICATATPTGVGGISVIRVSGSKAVSLVRTLCPFIPESPESHRAYFGLLKFPETTDPIDEVVATFFVRGRSFTGEDTFEISCHGSPIVVREILSQLTLIGARAADRGEFTYRAFMSGRIDLVQAESVLSLIESQSANSARQAIHQLNGSVSKELLEIEDRMIWCLAHMEASIDFSVEDIEVVANGLLIEKIQDLTKRLKTLVDSFSKGRILKEGFRLTLAGVPNVGKSSLLNLLVEEDRAIVTDIPGTTRDVIEASFLMEGLKVNVIDTAGLRESLDEIERLGIERSYQAQRSADGVFFVFDSSRGLSLDEIQKISLIPIEQVFIIGNKADQGPLTGSERVAAALGAIGASGFFQNLQGFLPKLREKIRIVSALNEKDGRVLKDLLKQHLGDIQFEDQAVISQVRHFENLSLSLGNMMRAHDLVVRQASPEFMSLEMKEALLRIQETLGKRFDDQIMDRVFSEFCIGK